MNRPIKLAFLLDSFIIGGGIAAVIEHCSRLTGRDFESYIVTEHPTGPNRNWHPAGASLRVLDFQEAQSIDFDIAIATWWKTCYDLHRLRARRYAYFVQSLENRFYEPAKNRSLKPLVRATYHLPVVFITEAKWIRDTILEMRPQAQVFYVRNGIDKNIFNLGSEGSLNPNVSGPLRILIEGPLGVWFKDTTKAIDIAASLAFPKRIALVTASDVPPDIRRCVDTVYSNVPVTEMPQIYRDTDILLKISKVEGMFMPPLEAFHCGATAVCSWVTGCEEYLRHGWNSLVAFPEDYDSIRRYFMLLEKDRRLLNLLRCNALTTANSWPSWEQSSRVMAAALARIADTPLLVDPYAALMIPPLFQQSTGAGPGQPIIDTNVILSSGSYRLARKISSLSERWPIKTLRTMFPDKLKQFFRTKLGS
jgi:glycosyltransferase involved in cell wall biosynthesis